MSTTRLLAQVISRTVKFGLRAGVVLGALYGSLIGHVVGLYVGAAIGAIASLPLALVDALLLAILLRCWFAPDRRGDGHRRLLGLVVGAVNVVCIVMLFSPEFLDFSIIPTLLAGAAGWYVSQRIANWYAHEMSAQTPAASAS